MPPFRAGISKPPATSTGKAVRSVQMVTTASSNSGARSLSVGSAAATQARAPARQSKAAIAVKPAALPTVATSGRKRSRPQHSDEDGDEVEEDSEQATEQLDDDDGGDDSDEHLATVLRPDSNDDESEDEDGDEDDADERKEAGDEDGAADVEIKDFFSSNKKGWSDDEDESDKTDKPHKRSRPNSTARTEESKQLHTEAKEATVNTTTTEQSSVTTGSDPSSSSFTPIPPAATFASLGVIAPLVEACTSLGWHKPTHIQSASLPHSLFGRDVIGLAETGSGKTAAFALPILQSLLAQPQPFHSLVLAPTRELAFQIAQQVEALGASIGVRVVVLVGGVDMVQQSIALAKKPHVVCATPGRIVDHLENTKGFNLKALKYLVLDEADRLLNMDFEKEIDTVLSVIPKQRQTFLFSATMTSKVAKLQRASLTDPVRVEVSKKYQVAEGLKQCYIFLPAFYKDLYLAWLCNEYHGQTMIVFTSTCEHTQHTTLVLRHLGFTAIPLHGKMPQAKRLGALNSFRSGSSAILVATDVASRGLDIPAVDAVINYDIPQHSKDYIHRVGRTARAGRTGKAITLVSQYDVELFQRIEGLLGYRMGEVEGLEVDSVMVMKERVSEASRMAKMEMRDQDERRKDKKGRWDDDGDDMGLGAGDDEVETDGRLSTRAVVGSKPRGGRGGGRGGRGGGGRGGGGGGGSGRGGGGRGGGGRGGGGRGGGRGRGGRR